MGKADLIEAEFPTGTKLPAELHKLCDYLDRTGYPISGSMRLRPEGKGLLAWFDGDAAAASQFAGFGAGPDGSILAFWLYSGLDTNAAPIVYLDSEGQNNIILAANIRSFLELFAIGYDELGRDDLEIEPEEPESAEQLRDWLLAEFGLVPPETGAALVQEAQSQHPNLAAWIQDWQQRRDRLTSG